MNPPFSRYLPEIFGICLVLICHRVLLRWSERPSVRTWIRISGVISVAALLLNLPFVWRFVPPGPALNWARGAAILWAIGVCGTTAALALSRRMRRAEPPADLGRRGLLQAAQAAVVAAPALALGYGTLYERRRLTPLEVNLSIPGLPKDLDGLRIAQLSDIHMSSFLSAEDLSAAVDMANGFRPHLAVVTGDLITRDGDPLDACLRELRRLKADSGLYGCLGNHEIYAGCEDYTAGQAAKFGLKFLRGEARTLRFGQARLRLAGVDYQKMHSPYLIGAQALQEPGAFQLLLSHNPDVFDTAVSQGWNLTLAGHTHGGQVTVEYLNQHLNFARFFTPYVYGHYEKENSHIFVTRGIGTVGVPVRIGAAPEVALVRLCAI
ncbi:MAG: metallophosphoesterase [Acidobacteria bacterium]|nr:metallophosphoesterase [Acidobacteriota bacterium]